MKKYILGLTIILLSACTLGSPSTPKQIVSSFLDKYKNQDNTILSQLDETIKNEYSNDDYRERYKNLMINQYKNMKYEITDEVIEGDNAVVEAKITVYDYGTAIRNANDYLNNNQSEFMMDQPTIDMENANDETTKDTEDDTLNNNEDNNITNENSSLTYDENKFIDYKLTQMENVNDTVTYNMEFTLTKVDGVWKLDSLSNTDIEKLHGIYIS